MRGSFLSGNVARKIGLAVFSFGLILNALTMALAYGWLHARFIEALQADAAMLARSAIDPRRYPTLDELVVAGENLMRVSEISGGTFVTGIGAERASFGDPPELSWAEARLQGVRWKLDDSRGSFETFIGPEALGVSYGLLLKVDSAARWEMLRWRLGQLAALNLAVALALATGAGLLVRRFVCRPLLVVAEALKTALASPDTMARHLSRVEGGDELAALSRAVDRLLVHMASRIEMELEPALAILEQSTHAILTFSPDGDLLSANRAALSLFAVDRPDELPGQEGGMFRFEGQPTPVRDLLAGGPVRGPGEVVLAEETIPLLVAGDFVRAPDGSTVRGFLMLVDMRDTVAGMREEVALRQRAEDKLERAEATLGYLRKQFEACLVIMEGGAEAGSGARPVAVDPEPVIGDWLDHAVGRDTMAATGVVREALPLLRGHPGEMRQLLHYCLETVRLRSGLKRPTILVSMSNDAETRMTIQAADPAGNRRCGEIAETNETSLFIGAISALAQRQGGQLMARQIGRNGNAIILELKLDSQLTLKAPAGARAAA